MLRLAEEKDRQACIRMARDFHSSSPYKDLKFDEQRCSELFDKYIEGDKTELIIILAGDTPFGMIIGFRSCLPFSSEIVCTEVAWWVDEDKRKTRDSFLLFKAYEDWTRRVGAKITQVAMLDEVTDLSGFYTKQGYKRAEQSFVRKI